MVLPLKISIYHERAFGSGFTLAHKSNKDLRNFIPPLPHVIKAAPLSLFFLKFHLTLYK